MVKYDINLREYWRVIKRRKLIIIFTIIVMGIFSFISSILGKPVPVYQTSSTIKVEKVASPTGIQQTMPIISGTDQIETQTYLIRSYYILELTAKKLGLIPADISPEEVRQSYQYVSIINDLQERVEAKQKGNSDLIDIIVTANDPKFAVHFCNTLTETYQTQHTLELNRRTVEGKKYIENQLAMAKERLAKAEETVKRFREQHKWSTLEAETAFLTSQINQLQTTYEHDSKVLQKVIYTSRMLDEAINTPLTSKLTFYFDEAPPPYKALNDRLVNLLLERDTLLMIYTEEFPQVKALKNQAREAIKSMKSYLNLQGKNLRANIRAYQSQLMTLNKELKELPQKHLELTRLEREAALAREVYTLLEKRYQETLIAEAEKIEEVKIVKPAIEPLQPINPPRVAMNTLLGTLLGVILGVVFAFIIETFDTSIGAIEEVEDFLGVRVMGVIPFVSMEEIKALLEEDPSVDLSEENLRRYARLAAHFVPNSTLAESYKALRTSFHFHCMENNLKTLLVTSSSVGEGKTSIVVNLAITMAQIGQKVLLLDGDLRRPIIARLFGIEYVPGFTDVILGNYAWHQVVRTVTDFMMGKLSMEEIMKTPGLDNLHLITSGSHVPNPTEIINSKTTTEFITALKDHYDIILIDAPPVLAATDAALWSARVDGTVIVYQVGKIARGALRRSKISLEHLKANIIGVVLNGLKAEISPDFGYHDYYYHYADRGTKTPSIITRIKDTPIAHPKAFMVSLFDKAKAMILRHVPTNSSPSEKKKEEKHASVVKLLILLSIIIFIVMGIVSQYYAYALPQPTTHDPPVIKNIPPLLTSEKTQEVNKVVLDANDTLPAVSSPGSKGTITPVDGMPRDPSSFRIRIFS